VLVSQYNTDRVFNEDFASIRWNIVIVDKFYSIKLINTQMWNRVRGLLSYPDIIALSAIPIKTGVKDLIGALSAI